MGTLVTCGGQRESGPSGGLYNGPGKIVRARAQREETSLETRGRMWTKPRRWNARSHGIVLWWVEEGRSRRKTGWLQAQSQCSASICDRKRKERAGLGLGQWWVWGSWGRNIQNKDLDPGRRARARGGCGHSIWSQHMVRVSGDRNHCRRCEGAEEQKEAPSIHSHSSWGQDTPSRRWQVS